jgi:hypothetical protein
VLVLLPTLFEAVRKIPTLQNLTEIMPASDVSISALPQRNLDAIITITQTILQHRLQELSMLTPEAIVIMMLVAMYITITTLVRPNEGVLDMTSLLLLVAATMPPPTYLITDTVLSATPHLINGSLLHVWPFLSTTIDMVLHLRATLLPTARHRTK